MIYLKTYKNGLRLILNKIDGLLSVTAGVLVKTGSANESDTENGISHFIEHNLFKGTKKRSSFEISDFIDGIGAQINAFTSKEMTCYYTKSTSDRLCDSLDVLSDIFFNSQFITEELEKEKGVVIEEINMCEDTPEDVCMDLLAKTCYGDIGLGKTILGPAENIKRFTKKDIEDYMAKYYTADNVVISIAGNFDVKEAEKMVEDMFVENFRNEKSASQIVNLPFKKGVGHKCKKIEQSHVAFALPAISVEDDRVDALSIANTVLGGGMSSRLFQKIREEMGLAYSIYSYCSTYKDCGTAEIYAGVNSKLKQDAVNTIIDEVQKFSSSGLTKKEFERGKQQVKSAFVFGQENTSSQMLVVGKYLLFRNKKFDFAQRISQIDAVTIDDVNAISKEIYNIDKLSVATVDAGKSKIKI
ncbi:MAG: insulinase family protein [Clostridiales bacterium]|nr:insulinase family protein [Clostridiales bacterium]